MTYTARLPFPLGLADGGSYVFGVPGQWVDSSTSVAFGDTALVIIRLCNVAFSHDPWPSRAGEVLKKLYGLDPSVESDDPTHELSAYEQWVTLETANARVDTEDPRDDGFAFHRCLEVLCRFLRSHYTIFRDIRVRPVSTHDLGPVVFCGAYAAGSEKEWRDWGPMFMHPNAYPSDPAHRDPHDSLNDLLNSYRQLDIHPFEISAEWLRRAEYARRYSGDSTEAVVSLQTSMESMIYNTWRMILVDQGYTHAEIDEKINDKGGYKQLLVNVLAPLLGGAWDTEAHATPVGKYWYRLYRLRNEIVHRGHQASWAEAEAAYDAYIDMREFINQRLWSNHRKYPRTLLIKLGDGGLERRGWNTKWMTKFRQEIADASGFFYLPKDTRR